MDVTLALGALDDLHHLFAGDVVRVLPALNEKFRNIADADAHLPLDIADAFAPDALSLAAGADHCAELIVFIEPVRKVLLRYGNGLDRYRLFNRDNVHSDARSPLGNELCRELKRLLRGEVEHSRDLGVLIGQGRVFDHIFAASYDPLRHPVLDMLIGVIPVLLEYADPEKVVDNFLSLLLGHTVKLGELLRCLPHPALFEGEHKLYLVLRKHAVEYPEIHMVFLHTAGQFSRYIVRYHYGELFEKLRLFGVCALVLSDGIVSLVDVDIRIDLFYHILHFLINMRRKTRKFSLSIHYILYPVKNKDIFIGFDGYYEARKK